MKSGGFLFVKPANAGAVIRDPRTKRQLSDKGGRVPDSVFWRRRLIAGEVVEIAEATPASGDDSKTAKIKKEK